MLYVPSCLWDGAHKRTLAVNWKESSMWRQRVYALTIIHMVKDHSDSEKGNLLPPSHRLLLPISSKGPFICTTPQTEQHNVHCYTSRGALAGTRNSSMGLIKDGSDDPSHHLPLSRGICARDRRALQQLALNVHVKHSDLT